MWKKSASAAGPSPPIPTPSPSMAHPSLATGIHSASGGTSSSAAPSVWSAAGGGQGSWSFLSTFLELLLWYFNFVHPIYIGAMICRRASIAAGDLSATMSATLASPLTMTAPNPKEVANCVVAFALLWVMELSDQVFLKEFIAMRNVYLFARILFCTYLLHPRFLGALHLYERCGIRTLVETYGHQLDDVIHNNVAFLKHQGAVEFIIKGGRFAMRGVGEVLYIVRQLMLPTAGPEGGAEETELSAAASASSPRIPPNLMTGHTSANNNIDDSGVLFVPSAASLSTKAAKAVTRRGGSRTNSRTNTPTRTLMSPSSSASASAGSPTSSVMRGVPPSATAAAVPATTAPLISPRSSFNAMLSAMNSHHQDDDAEEEGIGRDDDDDDMNDLISGIAAKHSGAASKQQQQATTRHSAYPPSSAPPLVGTIRAGGGGAAAAAAASRSGAGGAAGLVNAMAAAGQFSRSASNSSVGGGGGGLGSTRAGTSSAVSPASVAGGLSEAMFGGGGGFNTHHNNNPYDEGDVEEISLL